MKRKQKMVDEICRIVRLRKGIILLWKDYEERQVAKERRLKAAYINLKFSQKWKKRAKKWGGDYFNIHKGRIRRILIM